MANLKWGSTGDDVKKLQEALGFTGKDVDGIFGKKTQQAVKDYQAANNLTVDGIAGKNTLGKLYGTSSNNGNAAGAGSQNDNAGGNQPTVQDTSNSGLTFVPSDVVNQANAVLQQQGANKPGYYSPIWQDEADVYLSQYLNRDPFSYDFNSDALYQMYRDMYIQQGQMASMDAMGQAAALTGGYGNSYAQAAGQQAYNQYINQLNAMAPELYQMAYDRYTQEGHHMLDMYDLYMNRENQEYQKYRDAVADDQWQAQFDEAKRQYDQQYELQKKASKSSSGTPTVKYADFDSDTQDRWKKNFEKAVATGDLAALENVAIDMEAAKIDPKIVGEWYDRYAKIITTAKTSSGGVAGALSGLANSFVNLFK